jgi:hypothetical protein
MIQRKNEGNRQGNNHRFIQRERERENLRKGVGWDGGKRNKKGQLRNKRSVPASRQTFCTSALVRI